MQSITITDLRRAVRAHVDTLARHGLIPADVRAFTFTEGSKTNGIAYRIHTKRGNSSGHYNPTIGDDFLGMTKAEAFETITARTRTIIDVMHVLGHDADWSKDGTVKVFGIGEK